SLGAAQLRVARSDGRCIVSTGPLSRAPPLTAEPVQVAACDTLIIESTFGHPRYLFPPKQQVLADLEAWIRRKLEAGTAPVLLGYSLGKSQEVMRFLAGRGFDMCAHASVYEIAQLYQEFGIPLQRVRRFNGALKDGEVAIFPPHLARSVSLRRIWPRASAVLTGGALDSNGARRYGADVAFPLSDHADFAGLVKYARESGAKEVITHHGFADELAKALREAGMEARAIGKPLQL